MQKINYKKNNGISLVALLITIIIAIILLSTIIVSVGNYLRNSRISKLANEVSQVQDAVNAYYIANDLLPIKGEVILKDELSDFINEDYFGQFENELALNSDESAQFYRVDLELISIDNEDIAKTYIKYIVSYPNLNVYDIEGMKVGKDVYFSLSPKINDHVTFSMDTQDMDESTTNATIGATLKVKNNNLNNTNKLGIEVECSKASTSKIYIEFSNVDGKKEVKELYNNFNFDSLEELNDQNILLNNLSQEEINSFNQANRKTVQVTVEENDNIIAKEKVDVSNYDNIIPSISYFSNKLYDNMRVLKVNASDLQSGIKEIRYDYLKKTDLNGNLINYYDGISNFDNHYFSTKAKTILASDLIDGQVDLKIPTDVAVVCVVSVDNAGNMSDITPISYTAGIPCTITASVSSPTDATSIVYTFVFSEDVVGFTQSDINVKNGVVTSFTGSGKIYKLVVDSILDKKVIQSVSIEEGICENMESTARNYPASLQIEINAKTKVIEPQGISVDPTSMSLLIGETGVIKTIIAPANVTDNTVKFVSDNENIATVDEHGIVTGIAEGICNITATTSNGKKATCTVSVSKIKNDVESIYLDKEVVSLKVGQIEKVNAIVLPSTAKDRTVTYISDSQNIAKIDNEGNITGVSTGTTTIKAISNSNNQIYDTCTVVVENPITLEASITNQTNSSIVSSINSSTTSGTLTVQLNYKEKSASSYKTITLYSSGGSSYSNESYSLSNLNADTQYDIQVIATSSTGYSKTVELTAITSTEKVSSVTLNKSSMTLVLNQGDSLKSEQLTATVNPSTATYKDLKWGSSNNSIATVDSNGKVTAVAIGDAIITVSSVDDPTKKATCTVKVMDPVAKISNTYYATLSDAFEASSTSSSSYSQITMLKDVTYNYSLILASNKYVNLDLNGHSITFSSGNNKDTLINEGTLNISGSGSIKNTSSSSSAGSAIYNSKTLNIQSSCTISSNYDKAIYNASTGSINVTSGAQINGGVNGAIQNDGTFQLNSSSAVVTSSGSTIENFGTANIYYGTVKTTSGTAIKHYKGTLNVYYSSTVQSTSGTAIECVGGSTDSKTLRIGSSSSSYSTTEPTVSGTVYGVIADKANVSFYFYNGRIMGSANKSISGTPTGLRSGYTIQKTSSGSVETATLKSSTSTASYSGILNIFNIF